MNWTQKKDIENIKGHYIEKYKLDDDLANCWPQIRKKETSKKPEIKEPIEGEVGKKNEVFPCPGTKWEDVHISLTANDMVRIRTPQGEARFTYHQLKLQDKRKGDQPVVVWMLLKLFAKSNGFISSKNPNYDPMLPDNAKRLNKHLKNLFGIDESIYTGHYKKENGYRTRIQFSDQTCQVPKQFKSF